MQCPECLQYRHDGPCKSPLELAAPDLLEALDGVLYLFAADAERDHGIPLEHFNEWPSIEKARAAIAKAKGEA
jgi:hypothetical protein